jgi:hypothetical protein
MKALSIRQPWAWLIAAGYKDIENRKWSTKFRGRIYIHASRGYDLSFRASEFNIKLPTSLARGAIIGEVEIIDCITSSRSKWFIGPYGLLLSNPILYPEPIPCKGRLRFFEPILPR